MKNILLILTITLSLNTLAIECFTNKPPNGWQRTYKVVNEGNQAEIVIEDTLYFHSKFVLDTKLILKEDVSIEIHKKNQLTSIKGENIKIVQSWDNYFLVHTKKQSQLVRCVLNEN